MTPLNYSARVVLIFCVVVLAVVSILFSANVAATQVRGYAYCASNPNQPAVYFSEVFNTEFRLDRVNDTTPIGNEYNEYLKGRFDFKSNANYDVGCHLYESMSQAQSLKRDYEMQMRQNNKQVIEVQWDYVPEPGAVAPSWRSAEQPKPIPMPGFLAERMRLSFNRLIVRPAP